MNESMNELHGQFVEMLSHLKMIKRPLNQIRLISMEDQYSVNVQRSINDLTLGINSVIEI